MKKIGNRLFFVIAVILVVAFAIVCFAGCNDDPDAGKVEYDNEYEWEYDREFQGEPDEGMNIDGVLDEDVWKDSNRKWLTFSEKGATVSYTSYFTQKGLYLASTVTDPNLTWTARLNFNDATALNSAFCYLITSENVETLQMFTLYRFAFDSKNKASREQTPFAAKAVTDGDIEAGEATVMTGEFFATWDDLNMEVSEETGMPNLVNVIPKYRVVVDTDDNTANKWIMPLFAEEYRLHCYSRFNENGYMNVDAEDAVWGNAANGISKSDGWSISEDDPTVVTSDKAHSQGIFLTDKRSDRYIYSVDMQLVDGIAGVDGSDGIFRAGIATMCENSNDFTTLLVEGKGLENNQLRMYRLKIGPWEYTNAVNQKLSSEYNFEERNQTVTLKVIKDGANFYYFAEGELIYFNTEEDLAGECCPGVYTLSTEATFSNPQFTDFSDNAEELRRMISEYVYLIDAPASISGGKVEVDNTAIDKNDTNKTVTITIKPNNGYVLSSFTVNDEDKFDYVVENIDNGLLTLEVDESIAIDAEFTRFDRGNEVVKIRGTVYSSNGTGVLGGAKIKAYDLSNPLFCYDMGTNTQGRFELSFLKPQDSAYVIGDKEYVVGSEYVVMVSFEDGGFPVVKNFSANSADANGIIEYSFNTESTYDIVGDKPAYEEFNMDGSYTATATAIDNTAIFINNSSEIQGKNWTASVNVRTSTMTIWQVYGVAVKYADGQYMILGPSQRGSASWVQVIPVVNGSHKGFYDATNSDMSAVIASYTDEENLNVKVTYYESEYYVYLNDVLFRIFSAAELGVGEYGEPIEVGFGFRLDDSLPKSVTLSDWGYEIDVEAPVVPAGNSLELMGIMPASQQFNDDGSYTATAEAITTTALLIKDSAEIAGKSWTASVNIKTSTMTIWQVFGVAVKYSNGDYAIIGPSQRGSAGWTQIIPVVNGIHKGFYDSTNINMTGVLGSYLAQENLSVKVTYYGAKYYVYLNDVLFRIFTTTEMGVAGSGEPIEVGFGFRLDDSLPKSVTLSDWSYSADVEEPVIEEGEYTLVGNMPATQSFDDDGSYSVTTKQLVDTAILINESKEIRGNNWTASVNIKTSTLSVWQVYGIAIQYSNGDYAIVGPSQRGDSATVMIVPVVNAYHKGFYESTNSMNIASNVIDKYLSQENLNVKVTYYESQYYVYLNDVLFRVFSAAELGVSESGDPVKVGFGFRIDHFGDVDTRSLTLSDWSYSIESEKPELPEDKGLELVGNAPYGQVFNSDGSWTVTTTKWTSTGILIKDSVAIQNKNWTASVNVKVDTLTFWQVYGIAIKYSDGRHIVIGVSQRNSVESVQIAALLNNAYASYVGYDTTNGIGINNELAIYGTKENLNVKITYYDSLYYVYLNDVLYRIFSAADLGISEYGTPVQVGFGFRIDDYNGVTSRSLTFSDWGYEIDVEKPAPVKSNNLTVVGAVPAESYVAEDGSYTAKTEQPAMIATGVLMNASSEIQGKNWTAEVNVKTATLTLWQTYGIAIKYSNDSYVVIGASQRGSADKIIIVSWLNGGYVGEFDQSNTVGLADVLGQYLNNENLNVKVTYYNAQYYVYLNDVLFRVFSAAELGVGECGEPVAVGFGLRIDDFNTTTTPSLTFSDWGYSIDVAEPAAVSNDLTLVGVSPYTLVHNPDDSYTATANEIVTTGLLINTSGDIQGKSWTAQVNIKTSTLSFWQVYGIAIQYSDDNYAIIGPSQRENSTSIVMIVPVVNGYHKGFYESTNTVDMPNVINTYLSQDNLKVKVTYYNSQYYVYLNDVLFRIFSAAELGVAELGEPVKVGFGFRLDDSLPKSLTFSDFSYGINLDEPKVGTNNLTVVGSTPASQVCNADGSYTVTTDALVNTGLLIGSSSDVTGKNWTARVKVSTAELSNWQTYGIAVKYEGGNYAVIGVSQRGSTDWIQTISILDANWKGFLNTSNSIGMAKVLGEYMSKEWLDIKVTYYDSQYYVYLNDVLFRVASAAEFEIGDCGAPVQVGFGYRIDDFTGVDSRSLTFSDWGYEIDVDAPAAVNNDMTIIGNTPNVLVLSPDGTYTARTAVTSGVNTGIMPNSSTEIAGKNWSAEVNFKTSTLTLWQTYGIAIKYSTGNYVILGASQRGSANAIAMVDWLDSSYKGEFTTTNDSEEMTGILDSYLNEENLNVKVTYYESQYYVYLNGVLFRTLSATELGVEDFGEPVQVGIGFRMDDWSTSTTPSLSFSDWSYGVDVAAPQGSEE